MSGKRSSGRGRRLLDYLLYMFSGNAGLPFFGIRNVRPEDAEEQEAQRRRDRERDARGESKP